MRLFLWLAGADKDLLAQCKTLRRSEHIRFAGIGALLLIPPTLGFIGMSYAISLLTKEPWIYLGSGALWLLIVLAIDRYIVSTLHKSKLRNRGRVPAIGLRLVFAALVGVAISHPLLLLWFDESITQELDENRRTAVQERQAEAETGAATIAAASELARRTIIDRAAEAQAALAVPTDEAALTDAIERRNCLDSLLFAEQSGALVMLPCGASSGIPECLRRCETILARVEELDREIAQLSAQTTAAEASLTVQREAIAAAAAQDLDEVDARTTAELAQLDAATATAVGDIDRNFSYDYLARVAALNEVAEREPHVLTVAYFMVVFFVLIDVMPVMMKLTTPSGEYEELRDTALFRTRVRQQTERDLAEEGTFVRTEIEARDRYHAGFAEFHGLLRAALDELASLMAYILAFEDHLRDGREIAARKGVSEFYEEQVAQMRRTFVEALETALTNLEKYLRNV